MALMSMATRWRSCTANKECRAEAPRAAAGVAWQDFSCRDDTWEAPENVYPKAKLLKYENTLATIHVLGEPLEDLREALARRLTSKIIGERRPAWELPLDIPRISNETRPSPSRCCTFYQRSAVVAPMQ